MTPLIEQSVMQHKSKRCKATASEEYK